MNKPDFSHLKESFQGMFRHKSQAEKKPLTLVEGLSYSLLGLGLLGALAIFYLSKNYLYALLAFLAGALACLSIQTAFRGKKKTKGLSEEQRIKADFLLKILSYLAAGETFRKAYLRAGEAIKASAFKDEALAFTKEKGERSASFFTPEEGNLKRLIEEGWKQDKTSAAFFLEFQEAAEDYQKAEVPSGFLASVPDLLLIAFGAFLLYFLVLTVGSL
jgi:hypothetical protein